MPTAFDEITLGYKIASGLLEVGRFIANHWSAGDNDFRLISTLTTMEFTQEGADQVAYFVQDRTVKILKDRILLPHFRFGTDGEDRFEEISISLPGNAPSHHQPKVKNRDGRVKSVGIEEETIFDRNTVFRCVLTAKSINGFTNPEGEAFTYTVSDLTDAATVFIIFPKHRLPTELDVRMAKTTSGAGWMPLRREKNELRQFTGGRKAFMLEAKSPPLNYKYKIKWKW